MRITKETLANAFGATGGILWVACTFFVVFFPDLYETIYNSWTHGKFSEALGKATLTVESVLVSGITFIIVSWVIGYIFGVSLEFFSKKKFNA